MWGSSSRSAARIGKRGDTRSAQGGFVHGKIAAPAQQNAEIIVAAKVALAVVFVAHDKTLGHHLPDAGGNGGGVPLGPGTVDDIDLAEAAVIGSFAAHHKALAVAVGNAAQALREEHLKQIVDARNDPRDALPKLASSASEAGCGAGWG